MQVVLTLLLQLAAGLLLAPIIVAAVPLGRAYHIAYAVLLGALVWLAGLLVAKALKAPRAPTAATLATSIIGALIGVGIVLLPTLIPGTEKAIHLISEPLYLVAGALVGYWVRR
jgi:hypothetical protein